MATNKHYPILVTDPAGQLVDVDETGGAKVSQSVSEPAVQYSPGVPNPAKDPIGFQVWLAGQHTRMNGGRRG